MKTKTLLFGVLLLTYATAFAQQLPIWTALDATPTGTAKRMVLENQTPTPLLYVLNEPVLRSYLLEIKDKPSKKIELEIPNTQGVIEKFAVQESTNFEPELQAKYPNIRAYSGTGISDPAAAIYFSLSPDGMQTMVMRPDRPAEFIEKKQHSTTTYTLFNSGSNPSKKSSLNCKTKNSTPLLTAKIPAKITSKTKSNSGVFKTLRLALSCTGEYAAFFGGTKEGALAGMNATMTRVNGVFNRDLSIKLLLVGNNDLVIYTNPATDPYTNEGSWNSQVQKTLTSVITNSGYDIGHLFSSSGTGGDAGCIGCVCKDDLPENLDRKGSAYTAPTDQSPRGDSFDISFVAHEMGHQLGATHTYSESIEATGTNVEPGNGTTIMGYAGIGTYYAQAESDDYFNTVSISQIQEKLAETTCPISTPISNSLPTVSAGPDYTIPKGTPFVLTGAGASSNGMVSYCWEQNDSAMDQSGENSLAYSTKPNGPLFRSIKPSASPLRYMPAKDFVLAGNLSPVWESVSDVARSLNFEFTVRDNATIGQTNTDQMVVNVVESAGPFKITSQQADNLSWSPGSNEPIVWDVANTKTLVGSANVNIKLSTDGGQTFPITLLENTPNDGLATVIVPDVSEKNCRLMLAPTNNIYYALNSKPFAIGYKTSKSVCNTFNTATPFTIPESASYSTLNFTVPATAALITKVNLSVTLTHAAFSDLQLELINPQNKVIKLLDRNCSGANGKFTFTFDDLGEVLVCESPENKKVLAQSALSAYNNQIPGGTWRLRMRDGYVGGRGTLDAATLSICTTEQVSTDPKVANNTFIVYPNPAKDGAVTVAFFTPSLKGATIALYDMAGRLHFERQVENKGDYKEPVTLNNLATGIYFMVVTDEEGKQVQKIVVP